MKNIPYYFLKDELGISEDKMLKLSLNFGPVLALSVERSMRPKVQWLQDALRLSKAEVAHMIERMPGILLCSLEDSLAPKLRWFEDELGLTPAERRHVVKQCPQVLASSPGSLLLKMDYLRRELGLTREQVKRVVRSMPSILIVSTDNLQQKVDFLHEEVGLPLEAVPQLLVKAPAVAFALASTLKARVRFLRKSLGFSNDDLCRILQLTPRVLGYDLEARARPFVLYLTRTPFRFKKDEVRKMFMRSPSLLAINVSSRRFLETIEALKAALGVTEKELSSMLLSFPNVLSITADRIRATAQLLEDTLACNQTDFRAMLQRHPQLLGYRLEAIRQKLEVMRDIYEVQDMANELRPLVVKAPWLLSYSQANRLEPRLRAARDVGLPLSQAVTLIPLPEAKFDDSLVRASTEQPDLTNSPLLRQRGNAKLRKLLRVPKKKRKPTRPPPASGVEAEEGDSPDGDGQSTGEP